MSSPSQAKPAGAPPNKAGKRDESPSKDKKKDTRGRKKPVQEVVLTEEQKALLRQKHIEERCTRLRFIAKGGKMVEKLYETRIEHYSELQRLIAQTKPKTTDLYMCQFEDGTVLSSQNFKTCSIYRIRDMDTAHPLKIKFCPRVDTRWDYLEYHAGAPAGWKDKFQEKLDAKDKVKRDAENAIRLETEARKLMERLENGGDEEEEGQNWDDL